MRTLHPSKKPVAFAVVENVTDMRWPAELLKNYAP